MTSYIKLCHLLSFAFLVPHPRVINFEVSFATKFIDFCNYLFGNLFVWLSAINIMPNDGMIVPLAQSYIIGKNILIYYANFTMPNDESKAYELVLGANGIIGDIIGCIDNAQYQMLLAGVRDRVNFETQKMLSVQEQRVNTLVGEISRFAEQMDSVFGNISGEQMAGFISSMSRLSDTQISTEELAKAFVENAKENN